MNKKERFCDVDNIVEWRHIITALLTLVSMAASSQQVMLADSITKNPVCYATVYDANGTVIGRSDMGGCINLQKGFEYHISHISYQEFRL